MEHERWWAKPLRAVTLEFPASDVATIDVASIVDETRRGAVNTLCIFAIGYWPGGTAFYQSRVAPHYPGLGQRDLLAEAIEASHRNGQKAIAYVASIWGGREMFNAHPDWAQRQADGSPTAWDEELTTVAMCPNSPYRDYFAAVVQEIGDHYAVDGFYFDEASFQSWCSCRYCRDKFQAEYGQSLPTEARWDDPLFQTFLQWRYRQIGDWRQELYAQVKRPDRCIFFQGAFPLATLIAQPIQVSGLQFGNPYQMRFGVEWVVPLAHATDLAHTARIADLVHLELYRRAVREPLWWYGVSLRYGQTIAQGKRTLVLNMMAQSPFDLYGLPETEIRLSIAELLANCGDPLFARYYPDRVDEAAWNIVYDGLREAERLEPYLARRESIPYTAVLLSPSTIERFDHAGDRPAHLAALKGFCKALLQEHILFDVLTEAELSERLGGYRVLVLPNASCLPAQAKEAIRAFVAAGGGLVASFEAGRYDEHGVPTPADDLATLLGVRYSEEPPTWYGFDVYMQVQGEHALTESFPPGKRIPTGGIQVGVEPTDARIVASVLGGAAVHYGPLGDEPVSPAVLAHQPRDGGRAVLIAPALDNRYLEFGVVDQRKLLANAVRWAAGSEPPVTVENGPQSMAVTAFRQSDSGRTVVHLVDSVRDELAQPINELPQWRGIALQVQVERPPRRVFVAPGEEELSWAMEGGSLRVALPPLRGSVVVVVEHSQPTATEGAR